MGTADAGVTMRIDAHQHYWRFDPVRDTWITEEMAVLRRDHLPAAVAPLLEAAGIDGVVTVQADQSEAETDFLLSLATEYRFIAGVVGWVDLRAADLGDRLARWEGQGLLKGFRHVAQAEPDDFLGRDDVVAGVRELGRRGYSYDLLVYPRQLDAAERLVTRAPGVQFVLDHCAKPPIGGKGLAEWRAGFVRLARHHHVCCKLSGLVTEVCSPTWSDADLVPILDTALEAFGPDRLMFGSDWPVCLLRASYPEVADIVTRWTEALTAGDRDAILGGTARRVYRLEC